jgi:hypothetical protein
MKTPSALLKVPEGLWSNSSELGTGRPNKFSPLIVTSIQVTAPSATIANTTAITARSNHLGKSRSSSFIPAAEKIALSGMLVAVGGFAARYVVQGL